MSIRKLVAEKIEILRKQIAVWDSPSSSPEAKGKVVVSLMGNDPRFLGAIAKLATTSKPAVKELPPVPVRAITLPALPKPAAPLPADVSARTLQPAGPVETPERRRDRFFSILAGFLAGKKIDFEKTREFMASVFRSGVSLTRENWETLFSGMKEAVANGFYLLEAANAPKFFAAAPMDLVDDYVFGPDGAMILVLADISELKSGSKMPNRLVAKIWVLMAALAAIGDRLDDFGIGRVEALLTAVVEANGPEGLIGEIRSLLPTDIEVIHKQAHVPNYALAGLEAALNGNGHGSSQQVAAAAPAPATPNPPEAAVAVDLQGIHMETETPSQTN